MTIVFYVSGHGFGHAVRIAEVIRTILAREPRARIHVRSSAPGWLFPVDERLSRADVRLDVGVVQQNSLTLDPAATLAGMSAILGDTESILARESAALRDLDCRAVVGDIPPLAFAAAARASVPSAAIANFSWDWIYRAYLPAAPAFGSLIETMARQYGQASILLRLPFHGDLSAFSRHRDIPLIARRAALPKAELRRGLALDDRPAALLSFGGFGLADLPVARMARESPGWQFLAPWRPDGELPANLRCLDGRKVNHEDLVAAVDVVVTKPGYGIVAECLANGARVLYTSRGDFPEYPVLVGALERHATARYVAPEALLGGRISGELDALLAAGERAAPLDPGAFEGARVAAEIILEMAGGSLSASGP
ncbi:MAG: hypothetical protein Q8R92_14025 [Deltaproteobacteria bacterium]|nr:hypothetical protein [Deltaproteobacteria bacterium]